MKQTVSRRGFLGGFIAVSAIGCGGSGDQPAPTEPSGPDFPIVDMHSHPTDGVSIDEMVKAAAEHGAKIGIVEHIGLEKYTYDNMIFNDELLNAWTSKLDPYPVYKGAQAEGQEWPECFSKEALAKLDYVLTDAMTMPEGEKGWTKIWEPGLVLGDKQQWMDRYTDFHVAKVALEPIDILANVMFLPREIKDEFDAMWTEKRMQVVVDALAKHDVALEINARAKLPTQTMLQMARDAGVKFTLGTNGRGLSAGAVEWGVEMASKLGLTAQDFFTPPGKVAS
jgi:histidinol phosphatase-like PHP family hydrolase